MKNSRRLSFLLLISIVALFLSVLLYKINPEDYYVSDNLLKFVQANSIIENNFLSEEIRCESLKEFGNCKFVFKEFFTLNGKMLGPFPVYSNIIMSLLIKASGPSFVQWFSLFLMILGIAILYYLWDLKLFIIVFFILCSPIFFHSISFLDISLNFFLFSIGTAFLSSKSNRSRIFYYSPFFLGTCILFRPESIIAGFFLILFSGIILKNNFKYKPAIISFLIPILFFVLMNYLLYGNFLGTRIYANQKQILNSALIERLNMIKSLLFQGNGRYGYFGYTPIFGLLFIMQTFLFKRLNQAQRILFLSSVFSLISITLLSPNDSNIDWGTRYFNGILILQIVSLGLIDADKFNKINRIIFISMLLIFALYSAKVSKKYYQYMIDFTAKSREIRNSLVNLNAKALVFMDDSAIQFIGISYFKQPSVLIDSSKDAYEFNLILNNNKNSDSIALIRTNRVLSSKISIHENSDDHEKILFENLKENWKCNSISIDPILEANLCSKIHF